MESKRTSAFLVLLLGGASAIVNAMTGDGETAWFEGLLLVGVYALIALAFFTG